MDRILDVIPQAFYDLIARILPGSFFLFWCRLTFVDFAPPKVRIHYLDILNPFFVEQDKIDIWYVGGIIIASYFIGWILKGVGDLMPSIFQWPRLLTVAEVQKEAFGRGKDLAKSRRDLDTAKENMDNVEIKLVDHTKNMTRGNLEAELKNARRKWAVLNIAQLRKEMAETMRMLARLETSGKTVGEVARLKQDEETNQLEQTLKESISKLARIRHSLKPVKNDNGKVFRRMYVEIRNKDATISYRILKRRAEARMLEGMFTGTQILLVCQAIILVLFCWLVKETDPFVKLGLFAGLFFISVILLFSFRKLRDRSIQGFYDDLVIHHDVLFLSKRSQDTPTPEST